MVSYISHMLASLSKTLHRVRFELCQEQGSIMRAFALESLPTRERGRTDIPEGISWIAPTIEQLEHVAEAMRRWLEDAEAHYAR